MDQIKTGALIRQLRLSAGLTQKQLAEKVNVSDKAVSKWECGNGAPDVSLLTDLAEVFGTDVNTLLSGSKDINESEKGDMKKIRFYVCKDCGGIMTSTSEASVSCCGNRLSPIVPKKAEGDDVLKTEVIDGELFVTADHEMTKQHYISFLAYVCDSTVMMFRQYPEWKMQARLPFVRMGRLVWYCTEHGAFYQDIK
ncbi:XRE family transcriptional regulator [Ruminococcus albus SY3]|uniref:XRE family transcriptional regulator n=1 Tax=Ruminococcus albus SY3 TaxID=1341156 RepID=A0A011UJF2_RUMAL|nr:helix-turn-helix domain-containing protein [Ruminococcus albus]EXM40794.1 XRE family transcriptional regulator [Ruminococcus albus SY3]